MKRIIKTTILKISYLILGIVFSLRRLFKSKKSFGFLSNEFFTKDFINKKLCDIGGFGMTAHVISQYYNHSRKKIFEASVLLAKSLPPGAPWYSKINESLVIANPNINEKGHLKNLVDYSFCTNKEFDFLLSIDMYPWYEDILESMPTMPLIIWIRDPKSKSRLNKIGTISYELQANAVKNADDFLKFAREERDTFLKINKKFPQRPIIFVTNAHFMVPRAKELYNLKELNPHFLPNPIHYPSLDSISKSKKPTVCFLGRLDPVKRPWIYFELAKRFKEVDFIVCGQSSYPQTMNPIIERYTNVPNLKFLGLVEGPKRNEILSQSWVLINTSIHEGLPCSFLESFSFHTPILSSVDADDLVKKFGFYTGDIDGDGMDESTLKIFEDGLKQLLSNEKDLLQKGVEARKYIEKIYTFENFENSLKNILTKGFKKNYEL